MPDLTAEILPQLQSHRLPGLDLGEGLIHPCYAGLSLANIPASIPGWLGADPVPGPVLPPLDARIHDRLQAEYQTVVLFLVDGLGWLDFPRLVGEWSREFPALAAWPRLLENGLLAPLTSIALSTTSAALTSLWTAAAPSQHGVLAYEQYLKEYQLTANMISHSAASYAGDVGGLARAGFLAQDFLPVSVLGEHLAGAGVPAYAFQHLSIARSGLSTMLLRGAEVNPFRNLSDLWVSLEGMLQAHRAERKYVYAYWGDVDELSHRYTPRDERVAMEFATFSQGFDRFLRRLPSLTTGRTLVLVTADHGLMPTPIRPELEMKRHPAFLDHLSMLPTGEGRLPFLYVHPGHEEAVREYIARAWPGRFRLLNAAEALAKGLFGPLPAYQRVAERLGDWLVIPQGDDYFYREMRKENSMLARHGGFSPQEMLIPLMAFEV